MVKEDLLKVYTFAGAIWSSFKTPTNEMEAKLFDEVWFGILKPYPIEMVLTAIQEYATQSDFCNIAKVGEICKIYTEKLNGIYIEPEDVIEEIHLAASYTNCKENFKKLSPLAKEIVKEPYILARWYMRDDFETVIMSNVRKKVYNILEQKKINKTLQIVENNKKLLGE